MLTESIESYLVEDRRFPPSQEFKRQAVLGPEIYAEAASDRLSFWSKQAENLHWHKPFTQVLDWSNPPFASWFADGELNVSYNCLDRHLKAGLGDRIAIHWEGEPGDKRSISYAELTREVKQAANLLASLGISQGDRVAIYLPPIPEAVVAMLAVARLGAIHSVVFGGFSAEALRSRIDDAEAKLIITADGSWRKGKVSQLKSVVDAALELDDADGKPSSVEHVLVVKRVADAYPAELTWIPGRDLWWHEEIVHADVEHVAKAFRAENPLFILYTSGTTGKPKGIVHSSGGYLTQVAFTHRAVFDIHPESDVYWCTADIGWITGHSYVVYGPLANAATQVIYEGTPDTPHPGRWWDIIQRYGVTKFYTAPTAIRSFMKLGDEIPAKFDLSSLKLLGSVGEPINPEAWMWYRDVIGAKRVPVVDTWWQTETGAIMISALPGVTETKPGSAQVPIPGISVKVLDEAGEEVFQGGGLLSITEPWPAMLRGIWGEPERFVNTYWSKFDGKYFAGDGARLDKDGDFWLLGRVDDVMNISGHRLSTAELESALVAHPTVAEAAVVGASDQTTGQAVVAFVILRAEHQHHSQVEIAARLKQHIVQQIGALARPREIHVVPELPKTRSGKIMRRLLQDLAEGRTIGDTTTLADTQVMQIITDQVAEGN